MKRFTIALAASLACATLISAVQAADQPIPVRTAEYKPAVATNDNAASIDLVHHRYGRYYGRSYYGNRSYYNRPYYGYRSYYRPNYGYRPYYGGYYNAYRPSYGYGYGYRPGFYGGFYW